MAKRTLRISSRFALVMVVLVPALAGMTLVDFRGLQSGRNAVNSLYEDHLLTVGRASALAIALEDANRDGLLLISASALTRHRATADLVALVSSQLDSSIAFVTAQAANDPAEQAKAEEIDAGWVNFQRLLAAGNLDGTTTAARYAASGRLSAIFDPSIAAAKSIVATEQAQADQAHAHALASYRSTLRWMLLAALLAMLATAGVVGWLIRSVLPRTLKYSAFATDITAGYYGERLEPTGTDELADLGRTLDELARRRQAEDFYDQGQTEFTSALQVADSEQEAHDLVKRYLERAVPNSTMTVLNRNNSADRLQAVTAVPPESPLAAGLNFAKPRSCLAIRLARPHYSVPGERALLECSVCSGCPQRTTCTPLLVGGEVIGSILADHIQPLGDHEQRSIREAVIGSAPVLGNLRNLAIAELRAATDSLTGLPNRRAIEDTIKRMVAQSSRSAAPLAALMCDLDHFKSINDRFGHGPGDEVLAAVGAVFADTLRGSDFAGRYGGEEFLILLPGTSTDGALVMAERIRAGVAAVRVPAVDQPVTLSIGIAITPDHAFDAETIIRAADRALYAAKENGRDRIEMAPSRGPEASTSNPSRYVLDESVR